jgi:hypothetical protein
MCNLLFVDRVLAHYLCTLLLILRGLDNWSLLNLVISFGVDFGKISTSRIKKWNMLSKISYYKKEKTPNFSEEFFFVKKIPSHFNTII